MGVALAVNFLTGRSVDGEERGVFASRSRLVLVPVTVVDARGAIVSGLPRTAFSVFEDKAACPIATFSEEDDPVSLGVVFDTSGSMRTTLPGAKTALKTLFDECSPADEAFVNLVTTRPGQLSPFTSDFGSLESAIAARMAAGDTALIDGVFASLEELHSAKRTRKAIVVVSDGMDNHSRRSVRELMSRAVEADAQVYTISLFGLSPSAKGTELAEQSRGLLFLSELAGRTGGFSLVVRTPSDIASAAAQVGRALRNRYLIGYVPPGGIDGRWHSIRVNVALRGAKVYARKGYRAD
jgi:Ca-activated chloride channel family protein